jgi:DNA-binding response OmpR family regulator
MTSFEPEEPPARRGQLRPRALVVSEDNQLLTLVTRYFQVRGIEVTGINNLSEAPIREPGALELALFDVTARNNAAALAAMVEALQIPTIALSSAASSEAAAELLRAGADSVIMKPFTLDALDAHVEALRRRAAVAGGPSRPRWRYVYQELAVDLLSRTVTVGGERITLSAIQYHMLEFLCRHAGSVISVSQLSDAVWGPGYEATPTLIRSHIHNLRRLLGDSASDPRFIRTERQMGYWMPRGEEEPT